jgi:hypothetical protein
VNAFAALVILSKLKEQDDQTSKSEDFGLMGFIKMTPQERIEMFESPLGGRKLLERVGVRIGTKWH